MKIFFKEIFRPLYHIFKNKKYREFLRLYNKFGAYKRFKKVENISFLNYKFDLPDLPSFVWQFKDIFVDEIYKIEANNDSPIIYDCGSNVGISLLYFSLLYPKAKIIGIEADKDICGICEVNMKKNNINNVDIINKAVWIDNLGVDFSIEGGDGGNLNETKNTKKIESIRLKDLLEKESKIDLLKIDIEGAEHEVIKDCAGSLSNVQNIFIEYHSWSSNEQKLSEILAILEKNNFRYYIDNITNRRLPFIYNGLLNKMDLQLNIFGYKI